MTNTFTPGPTPNTVQAADGRILTAPEGWILLPPGDAFHPNHALLAERFARVVTDYATPVGSGTVARTKRIPVEKRAEAAMKAWLRHQTTGYDGMVIPRVRGKAGRSGGCWPGFFWGKTPDELRRSKTISDALTQGWLEMFEKKTKEMGK
jgi:hypothetical protein